MNTKPLTRQGGKPEKLDPLGVDVFLPSGTETIVCAGFTIDRDRNLCLYEQVITDDVDRLHFKAGFVAGAWFGIRLDGNPGRDLSSIGFQPT